MNNQSDDAESDTSSTDDSSIRRMFEPIVAERHQMNQTSLKFRHLALNATGKSILNSNSLEQLAMMDRNRYICPTSLRKKWIMTWFDSLTARLCLTICPCQLSHLSESMLHPLKSKLNQATTLQLWALPVRTNQWCPLLLYPSIKMYLLFDSVLYRPRDKRSKWIVHPLKNHSMRGWKNSMHRSMKQCLTSPCWCKFHSMKLLQFVWKH